MKRIATLLTIMLLGYYSGIAQVQYKVDSVRLSNQLVGLSAAVIKDGRISAAFSSGIRDVSRNLLVDDSTMFRVASISKLVTSTGLMLLYDRNLFKLDDDVSQYLGFKLRNPNFPDVPITFRMLLSHTASLNDGSGYGDFLAANYSATGELPSLGDLVLKVGRYYSSDMWLDKKPGTYFCYCNANFGVIATLIEKLSGKRFDLFMEDELFKPLGVKARYNVARIENIDNLAAIYRYKDGWMPQVDACQGVKPQQRNLEDYAVGTNGFLYSPQGGLRTSAADLAKLMLLHINNGMVGKYVIIRSKTIKLMRTPQWIFNGANGDTSNGLFMSWGLGMQLVTNTPKHDYMHANLPMFGHAGDAYGLISGFYFNPSKKIGIIYMANGARNGYEQGGRSAYYRFEEQLFEMLIPLALASK